MSDREIFEKGLEVRREVLGSEYVEANLAGSDEFMMSFQTLVTEIAWGRAWTATALDKKSKCILSLGILAASGRSDELGIYTKGAVATGVTVEQIKEILIHVTAYCGTPTGRQAFLAAHAALVSIGALPDG